MNDCTKNIKLCFFSCEDYNICKLTKFTRLIHEYIWYHHLILFAGFISFNTTFHFNLHSCIHFYQNVLLLSCHVSCEWYIYWCYNTAIIDDCKFAESFYAFVIKHFYFWTKKTTCEIFSYSTISINGTFIFSSFVQRF